MTCVSLKFNLTPTKTFRTFEAERQHHRTTPKGSILQRYFRYDEILQFLDALEVKANKSSVNVTVKTIGRSFEGRDIKTVTISSGKGKANNSIFIDAGIHAREWIAVSTALYVIDQLASGNYSLQDFDWVILPVVNPDGYEYTHQSDRLWRKTRSNVSGECIGVDGNRNFDFHWAEVGASGFSCSETYRGEKAFSESETAALRDAVMSANDTCKLYLTLHSFGNYLLYPWGWTSDLPASWKDLHEVGESAANAMKEATGTSYTVGSSTNVLYAAAGGSDDYMFAKANIPFSYTMELSQGGHSGFDPPPSKIEGFVKESFIGIVKMAEEIAKRFK